LTAGLAAVSARGVIIVWVGVAYGGLIVVDQLPADGELLLAAVCLPPGRRIAGYGSGGPVAWATTEPVPDAGRVWNALLAAHPETGLVPILLDGLPVDTLFPAERAGVRRDGLRPWDNGEFGERMDIGRVDALDPATVLDELWIWELPSVEEEEEIPDFIQARAPFTRQFPGIAAAEHTPLPAARRQAELDSLGPARIGLVPADRPADVLLALGWDGTANWGPEFSFQMTAVLRSWEERFGARLLKVGFDEISLLVDRPPRSIGHAQRIAAEHFVFCDECAGQGPRDIPSIAASLMEAPIWAFWWD
jgi:Domain of unknown function (DUF4253)